MESEYEPSVLDWSEDDVVLVYAKGSNGIKYGSIQKP